MKEKIGFNNDIMSQHNNYTMPYIINQLDSLNQKFSFWEYWLFDMSKKLEKIEHDNAVLKHDFEKIKEKVEKQKNKNTKIIEKNSNLKQ